MLSSEEREEIESEITHYEQRQAACIESLKILQRHRGWISDESLHDLAPLLGMSVHELDNVATFYNLIFRRPVGEHVILLCDSVSCWLLGYERIRLHLRDKLGIEPGQTTADGRFTLLPMPCLGDCDHAPALMIDEDLHHDLDESKLDRLLERYR
jgi:NADH-quinone oxidoreductase subunit E